MLTKCLTTIQKWSRVKANVTRNARIPNHRECDIVSSLWKHKAAIELADFALRAKLKIMSADWFIGVPFNILSYSFLTHYIAKLTGFDVGTVTITFGNAHIYENHVEQCQKQLSLQSQLRDICTRKLAIEVFPQDNLHDDVTAANCFHVVDEDYTPLSKLSAPVAK